MVERIDFTTEEEYQQALQNEAFFEEEERRREEEALRERMDRLEEEEVWYKCVRRYDSEKKFKEELKQITVCEVRVRKKLQRIYKDDLPF